MRTRDEVLRAFGRFDPQWEEESIARMADRIRELEAAEAWLDDRSGEREWAVLEAVRALDAAEGKA